MIELYEDPQLRKMQLRLLDLDDEIKALARDLVYRTVLATPDDAHELAVLILERNNLRIALATK